MNCTNCVNLMGMVGLVALYRALARLGEGELGEIERIRAPVRRVSVYRPEYTFAVACDDQR